MYKPLSDFLKKNKDNEEKKNANNNLDNSTNPFGTFYNFQTINSVTFMANRKIQYPTFCVVDKNYNIVKDKQGKPMEFASPPEVRNRLKLTPSEQSGVVRILGEKYRDKTFPHEGTRYTCILKDKVSNFDGSINNDMLKNEAERMFNIKNTSNEV